MLFGAVWYNFKEPEWYWDSNEPELKKKNIYTYNWSDSDHAEDMDFILFFFNTTISAFCRIHVLTAPKYSCNKNSESVNTLNITLITLKKYGRWSLEFFSSNKKNSRLNFRSQCAPSSRNYQLWTEDGEVFFLNKRVWFID